MLKGKRNKAESRIFLIQLTRLTCSKSAKLNIFQFRLLSISLLLFTFYFLLFTPVSAQNNDKEVPLDVVPPPLNLVTKDENKQLKAVTKLRDRTKLALELMEARLLRSEELLEKTDYQESLNELGIYQGILIDTLKFLKSNQHQKASLKHFKKLEMNLRDVLPRLELLRREMPFKFGYHVKQMMFFVRESRTKALNPLFDDTVLPEGSN